MHGQIFFNFIVANMNYARGGCHVEDSIPGFYSSRFCCLAIQIGQESVAAWY